MTTPRLLVLLCGLLGASCATSSAAQRCPDYQDTVMAIAAARDLHPGLVIVEEDLFAVEIPPEFLHEDVLNSPEYVVGRIPRERVLANEFVRAQRLMDSQDGDLLSQIPRGMRAMSLSVEPAEARLVHDGDYVDLVATRHAGEAGEACIVDQAVYVMRVRRDAESGEPNGLVLALTPESAARFGSARSQGAVHVGVRNTLDIVPTALRTCE